LNQRFRLHSRLQLVAVSATLALGACVSAPPPAVWSGVPPEVMVAEIRAAQAFEGSKATPGELDVQPLRDPTIEDLRQQALAHERAKRFAESAAALDKALTLSPDDPALLQERAEAAVLVQDIDRAERLARNAYEIGSKVGPLCRRHWATIAATLNERAQQRHGQAVASRREEDRARFHNEAYAAEARAADAKRQIEACTLTGPPRY
jgi:tetratricopeptide (TPR) repeat protein